MWIFIVVTPYFTWQAYALLLLAMCVILIWKVQWSYILCKGHIPKTGPKGKSTEVMWCYRTFPCGCGIVASHFFSVSLKVIFQGNLCRRFLQGPQSATTGWLSDTSLSSGFFVYLFICGSSLLDYKLVYYNTLSGVSTGLWVSTHHLQ